MSKLEVKAEPLAYIRHLRWREHQGLPKYLQLRQALAAAIEKGVWKPGARLPTEDDLTRTTGLSLGTVQRALRVLAEEGVVLRRQGHGTFVGSEQQPMNAPFYHCRFLNEAGTGLLPIYSTVIRRGRAKGKGAWSQHMRGANVVCIERTFSVNGEFAIYTHLYIDGDRFPAFAKWPMKRLHGVNFKNLLSSEFQLPLTRFTETLVVLDFPRHICKAIGVRQGTSGVVLEIVARAKDAQPVYFQDLYIPPAAPRMLIA